MLHFPCLTYCVFFFYLLIGLRLLQDEKDFTQRFFVADFEDGGTHSKECGWPLRAESIPPLITSKEMEPQYYNHKELNSALAMGAWKRTPSSRWEGTTLFSIDLICQPYLYHEPFTTTEICPIFASSWNSFPFFSPYFLYQAFQFKACNNPLNCQIIKEKIIKLK